jgi:hypothetical protein
MPIGDARGRIISHPKASGFVMSCSETVAIALDHLHGLPVREDGGDLLHSRIHRIPKVLIALRRGEHD